MPSRWRTAARTTARLDCVPTQFAGAFVIDPVDIEAVYHGEAGRSAPSVSGVLKHRFSP